MSSIRSLAYSSAREIFETDYPGISHSENVSKLISLLQTSGSYEALVTNDYPPKLVTVRDVLKVTHPERTSVSRISFRPPSVSFDTPIYDASLKLVHNRIRILPVMEKESVVGVVRQTKILEKMADCDDLKTFFSEDLMVENLVTVSSDSLVGAVRSIMLKNGISHAPVVDQDGKLKGIITAKDLVWHFVKPRESMRVGEKTGEKIRLLEMRIRGLTDKNPFQVMRRTSILNVVREMIAGKKSYSLVVEKHKPIGIITPRDVISLLTEFRPKIQIPVYIVGFKGQDEGLVQSAKRKIERVARRGLKMHPDLREIVVHGKVSSVTGERRRFTIKARAYTPSSMMAVTAKGWSLLTVFDEICEKLDRRLRRT
ncbi:MAG: CBS domain-containing protein [archaeon]|nr:CBS domain-containing protein [archaeon]